MRVPWSEDDVLLSLPWELLCHDGAFLVREGQVDLVRTIPGPAGPGALVPESDVFKLVANVSAPEGSGLDYEGESYRITRGLSESCQLTPTELGSVADLIETASRVRPTGIHFSGHGSPGQLQFEDDEGRGHVLPVDELAAELKRRVPGGLPPFFYLASCHGNEPAVPEEGRSGAESSAAHLHRAGVAQVVGYYGPIHDELSTRAEVALYGALTAGEATRYAMRQAREALRHRFRATGGAHRPGRAAQDVATVAAGPAAALQPEPLEPEPPAPVTTHPFAWAQLVFYHRGPERPLCKAEPAATRRGRDEVLERTFEGLGGRKVLQTGFVGRRVELHRVRQRIRRGDKVFVFQGLGGLGKSTLALRVLPMLGAGEEDVAILWCQETETRPERAEALVAELLAYCRGRFGPSWEQVVSQVDRVAGDDPARRFGLFLDMLLQNVPRLVLYLDNLESLLVGPDASRAARDEGAMGEWRSAALASIWQALRELARQRALVVASCRYRHPDFAGALMPVSPLPPDALYRLMRWFPGLRRLTGAARAGLVSRLAGHPRAVEFADDLVSHALAVWDDDHGPWRLSEPPTEKDLEREQRELLQPALPRVQEKLWDDLLLSEIWDRVLDDPARRMLFRMTLLRRPWEPEMNRVLGESGAAPEQAGKTAERLLRTSLLEQVELWRVSGKDARVRHLTLHPATARFIAERFEADEELRCGAHARVGEYLEARAEMSGPSPDGDPSGVGAAEPTVPE